MKKSLLAFALISAFSSAAMAQSSVVIYGVLDVGIQANNDGKNGKGMTSSLDSGLQSGSRLGFKGTEDLGNGLKANFVLEMAVSPDTGVSDGFTRQAYVGLSNDMGNIRLGRQESLAQEAGKGMDPFAEGLAGDMHNFFGVKTRLSNAVSVNSAKFAGFSASAMYGFGEAADDTAKSQALAASANYTIGGFSATVSYEDTNDAAGKDIAGGDKLLVGGSYNFGFLKAFGTYGNIQGPAKKIVKTKSVDYTAERSVYLAGVTVPLGTGTLMASYTFSKDANYDLTDATQYAIGYSLPLSKRTNVYTSYAMTTNSANVGLNAYENGLDNNKVNVGVRHSF